MFSPASFSKSARARFQHVGHLPSRRCFLCAGLCMLLFGGEFAARGYTYGDAATMFNSFSNVFYVQSGTNAWFRDLQSGGTSPTYFWGQANEIECVIDAYEVTSNTTCRAMVSNLLNGFTFNNGTSWSWNVYNDDVMWACMAFARGYLDTGNTAFRDIAKANFDMCYARGWDTSAGGMYWTTGNTNKVAAVNGPASIAAYLLYQIYGDASYLTKATNIYSWERTNLFVSTTGMIYDGMRVGGSPGGAATTYNQGTFIGAASFLGQTNDAMLAANYTMNSMTTSGILPQYGTNNNNSGFNAIFIRWMTKFLRDRGFESAYRQWLQDNANAAWNYRRASDNLSWCQWRQQTPAGVNLYSWDCLASFEILQVVRPTQTNVPGTVTLTASDSSGASSFSSAGKWSDGNTPSWTNDYVVNGLNLRTPADSSLHNFYGNSLVLTNAGALRLTTSGSAAITVGTMLSVDNGIVSAWTRPAVLGGWVRLQSGGGVLDPQSLGGFTITAPIEGPGALTVASDNNSFAGTLILTCSNSYGGGTIINGPDTLQLTNLATLGLNTGGLTFEHNGNGLSIPFTPYTSAAYGMLNLNGVNVGVGNLTGGGGRIANNSASGTAVLTIGNGNNGGGNFYGAIMDHTTGGGSIALAKTGTSAITLAASNSYTGGTTISGGTLQLGDGVVSNGVVAGNITNNAQLVLANPISQTFSGIISGLGAVTKIGAGTLICTATNTYSGGTLISTGVLQLGDGAAKNGVLAGLITNNSALAFANSWEQTFSGTISGSGAMTKSGAGVLTLSGTNTYAGSTSILAGTLALGGSGSIDNSAGIIVSGGAVLDVTGRSDQTLGLNRRQTLTGSGVINGSLNAKAGSIVNPGDGIGVLTVQSNLILSSLLVMELNRTNAPANDRLNVLGNISAAGTLIVSNLGSDLLAGDVFPLFNKPASGFSLVVLPQLPPNLMWTNNLGVDGTIRVLSTVSLAPVSLGVTEVGTNLVLSWPADHTGWRLQAQTNSLETGLGSNWVDVSGSNATNQISVPAGISNGSVFFRVLYP
jgi:autotransporter-associated beta strand protein